jgi:hypothetical protein
LNIVVELKIYAMVLAASETFPSKITLIKQGDPKKCHPRASRMGLMENDP